MLRPTRLRALNCERFSFKAWSSSEMKRLIRYDCLHLLCGVINTSSPGGTYVFKDDIDITHGVSDITNTHEVEKRG